MRQLAALPLLYLFVTTAFASTPDFARSRANPNGIPLWIAADKAIDETGEIRAEYFYPHQLEDIEEMRKKNSGRADCQAAAVLPYDTHRKSGSLDELTGSALTIATGTVVESRSGFYIGTPATLLAVRLTESIKTLGLLRPTDTVYLVVGDARIETKRGRICGTSYMGVTIPTPKPGDHILFFAFHEPGDEDLSIYHVDLRNQLVVERDRKVHAPRSLEQLGNIDSLEVLVRTVGRSPRLNDVPRREAY
jgi:hypothetical protein